MFNWMAWTLPSGLFFIGIACILLMMTFWEIRKPCTERKGWLPIATTRGDRLFIGLLSSAFIHLGVIGFSDLSLWIAFMVSLLWIGILLRWG